MAECMICGSEIPEGADACPVCGAAIGATPVGTRRTREEWVESTASAAGIEVGFSPKFDTPEFQTAMGASNKSYTLMIIAIIILFPILVTIVGTFTMGPVGIAGGVFFFFITLFVGIYFLIKRNAGKTWDGEVIDLIQIRQRDSHGRRKAASHRVLCRTDVGKKVKVIDDSGMHSYLNIGDRVRFHPRLNVPLEKYDKTHDTYLLCPFCRSRQPLDVDYCTECGKPLLK